MQHLFRSLWLFRFEVGGQGCNRTFKVYHIFSKILILQVKNLKLVKILSHHASLFDLLHRISKFFTVFWVFKGVGGLLEPTTPSWKYHFISGNSTIGETFITPCFFIWPSTPSESSSRFFARTLTLIAPTIYLHVNWLMIFGHLCIKEGK